MFTIILLSRVYNLIIFLLKRMVGWLCFLTVLQNSWHIFLLSWRFMPGFGEEIIEAEMELTLT